MSDNERDLDPFDYLCKLVREYRYSDAWAYVKYIDDLRKLAEMSKVQP